MQKQEGGGRYGSTNWLTVYPAKTEAEVQTLYSLLSTMHSLPDTQEIVMCLSDILDSEIYQGRRVSSVDLQLFKQVLSYISLGIRIGLDEAISLKSRRITDRCSKKSVLYNTRFLGNTETWTHYSGDYSGPLIHDAPQERNRSLPHLGSQGNSHIRNKDIQPILLQGDTVHFLAKRIIGLLDFNRNKPTVFIDIGSMYSTTLLELASYFSDEIIDGRLILVGTNLGLDKKSMRRDSKFGRLTQLPKTYYQTFITSHHLVHFISGDVQSLMGRKLKLPTQDLYTLDEESADIVHENWSVSLHSKSLEYDAMLMASLIGSRGILMSHTHDGISGYSGMSTKRTSNRVELVSGLYVLSQMSHAFSEKLEHEQSAFEIKNVAYDMMRQTNRLFDRCGYTLIDSITNPDTGVECLLNYAFWLGKEAKPLALYTASGNEVFVQRKSSV